MSISSVFAEVLPEVTSVNVVTTESVTTESGSTVAPVELIQYDYYHSETCRFCQMLDAFLKENKAYDKLNINKIDVAVR